MKKTGYLFGLLVCLLFVSIYAFALADVEIDGYNFPDNVFRNYITQFDLDGDGILSDSEAAAVKTINVANEYYEYEPGSEYYIYDLKGLEYFTALTSLDCSYNFVYEIDISKNKALQYLNVSHNHLSGLDVSHNPELISIICGITPYWTTSDELWEENSLNSLNVSMCPKLETLRCTKNGLSSLNISGCKNLKWLACSSNSLAKLDVSGCPVLVSLVKNSDRLTEEYWDGFDYWQDGDLFLAVDSRLPVITDQAAPAAGDVLISAENFPDQEFRMCVTEFDTDGNGILSKKELKNVQEISVYSRNIATLKGLEYFTALTSLDCSRNQLTSLDISKNKSLKKLNCSENQINKLNVSKSKALNRIVKGIEPAYFLPEYYNQDYYGWWDDGGFYWEDWPSKAYLFTDQGVKVTTTKGSDPEYVLVNGSRYELNDDGTTVSFVYAYNNFDSLVIQNTVKIGKKKYKVTAIANEALSGYSTSHFLTLREVTIGKNIKSIGKKAFYGCDGLTKITILSGSLKTVGSKAFSGTGKKARVICPKKKIKAYQKLLKNAGLSKKATFEALQ